MDLVKYLTNFYKKTHPLENFSDIEQEFEETFQEEWTQGSLYGWESIIARMRKTQQPENSEDSNFCQACNKTFTSASVFMHHRKGKKHIKAVNEMAKNNQKYTNAPSEFSDSQIVKLKTIAYLETWL